MTSRLSPELVFETTFTQAVAEVIGSPRALCVWLLLQNREYEQLASLTIRASDYQHVGNFADDYLVTELMRKSANLPLGVSRERAALLRFYEAEAANRETNDRFSMTDAVDHPDWWWRCQKYLRRIMGPCDRAQLTRIENSCKHGPGKAVGLDGDCVVPSFKYDSRLCVTEELLPFLEGLLPAAWADYRLYGIGKPPLVKNGNRFFTVRKNATTDRGCAKPVLVNQWLQQGCGIELRDRLRYFGINLQDQGLNQFLASKAQEWGLATLDLKDASGYMATGPVLQLVSDRWGHLLNLAREKETVIPKALLAIGQPSVNEDRTLSLQQFCAMGNGFTFALQTAVFISVVRAIVPEALHGLTTAYGDDIVCPQDYALEVCAALEYLGFKVNHSKSNLAGCFFESCGTDWFHSHNVRPFYLRRVSPDGIYEGADAEVERPEGIPYALQAANALRLWTQRRAQIDGLSGCDSRFRKLWESLVAEAPKVWRLPIPKEFGDSGFIVDFSEISDPRWSARIVPLIGMRSFRGQDVTGWEGFMLRHMALTPVKVDRRTYGVLLSHLSQRRTTEFRWYDYLPETGAPPNSAGQEPVRGLFGRAVARWTNHIGWSEGLCWL